jgi:CheY-like chemotaxis protein
MEAQVEGMNRCILALESDKNDIYQLQRAFERAEIKDRLIVVRNRDEALCYLKGAGVYSNRIAYPLPRLMLIDVIAESCGGMEIVQLLKTKPEFSTVILIATGRAIPDATAQRLYDLGANAVFQKPGDLHELSNLIKSLIFVPPAGASGNQPARA